MGNNNLDKKFDVPDFIPEIPLTLQKVGVKDRVFPIKLLLPNSTDFVSTCRADIYCSLNSNQRGIHVSRISEAIQCVYKKEYSFPQLLALDLSKLVTEYQNSASSQVDLSFYWTNIEKTPITELDCVQSYQILSTSYFSEDHKYIIIGVKVPGITACPCVQLNTLEYYRNNSLLDNVDEKSLLNIPFFSHTQRILITVQLKIYNIEEASDFDFRKLIHIIKKNIPQTFDLLKRIDEVKLVEYVHLNPMFCEDVTRILAKSMSYELQNDISGETEITISVSSIESIHSFDLTSEICMTLKDLKSFFESM
jgi:TIGR00294 family protein